MLNAFIDDSASDVGDKRLFLAGFVNTAARWMQFSDEWAAALKAPPAIRYFRTVEAEGLRDEFERWSGEARNAKVLALAAVVQRHNAWSIECSVSRDDYNRILKPVAPRGLGNPYFGCFYGVVITLARFHREIGIAAPVDFVFDDQGGLGTEAILFYDYVKALQEPEVGRLLGATPVFRDDKDVVALQAADMLAWHVRRDAERQEPHRRAVLDLIRADGRHVIAEISAEVLEGLAHKMRQVPQVRFTQGKGDWRRAKRELSDPRSQQAALANANRRSFVTRVANEMRTLWRRMFSAGA